jgi:predicted nucleic acid-binding protein
MVPILHQVRACRDPKDDMLLELAVSGDAHLVVTGDADLLEMSVFRGVRILTPAAYLRSPG